MSTALQEKAIGKIIKVGQADHIDAMLNHGEVYLNAVNWFRQADKNTERFDRMEGATEIDQVTWIKLRDDAGNEFEFSQTDHPRHDPKYGVLQSAHKLTFEESINGNIFSCTGVAVGEEHKFKKLDRRSSQFGDSVLLIQSQKQFLNRVDAKLRELSYEYECRLVEYFDSSSFIGMLDLFRKKIFHSYQNELRIWIKNDSDEPITFKLGPLSDIAIAFSIDGILESA